MAKRQDLSIRRALQEAPELRPFIIPNVRPTGRELGGGSYGIVQELEIDGVKCAGKKIYDTLIDPENEGAQRMVGRYYGECKLLSELRHPHIVQFLGVCFVADSQLPVLVMELLTTSLDELLENTADIPLSTKLSILQDVARGLVYLHNRNPVVIHRDLSARNVLLNSAMTAKIADMGNSRIVDIPPGQLAKTMTHGPGTLVYMPPEALDSTSRYGPSLDMFSFGHLSLFTAIQIFPKNLLAPTYVDAQTKQVKARTELERRAEYIGVLYKEPKHPLVDLIKGCLENDASKRTTAKQALERLEEMREVIQDPYGQLNRAQLEKCLIKRETEVQQLAQLRCELKQIKMEKEKLERAYKAKEAKPENIEQLPLLKSELEQIYIKTAELKVACKEKDAVIAVKDQENVALQRALSDERQRVSSLNEECATLKGSLEGKTEEVQSLQAHNQESTPPKILTGNLNWKLIEMPTGVMGAQAVVIGGKVYIGGGFAEGNDYKILEYTVQGGYWREMKTPVSYYGLAAVNGQVMITGGVDKKDEATNQVWVLDSLSDTWIQPFPPLPATRKATSAVNYKKWVLVAGGKDVTACSELYILDSASKVWYNALPLPTAHGAYNPSLAVMHDTLYVAWGFTAVSISIPALISDAVSQYPATSGLKWNPLPNLSTKQPTLVVFHGALLTVGTVSHPPSSTIAMYCPQTEQWLTVAQLPTPRRACTCVTLPDTEELMVIGGSNINMGVIKTIALCTL